MSDVAEMAAEADRLMARVRRLREYLASDPANQMLQRDLFMDLLRADRAAEAIELARNARPVADDPFWPFGLLVAQRKAGEVEAYRETLALLGSEGHDLSSLALAFARPSVECDDWAMVAVMTAPLEDVQSGKFWLAGIHLRVRSLHHLGQMEDAIGVARHALAYAPDARALEAALATLYLDLQEIEQARALYSAAAGRGEPIPEMSTVGGFLWLSDGDERRAQKFFEGVLQVQPDLGRAHLGLGLSFAYEGRIQDAKAALAQAVNCMPEHLGSWHALAWIHLLDQELDLAHAAFMKAFDLNRNFGETAGGLAVIEVLRGDRSSAQTWMRRAMRLEPMGLNAGVARALLDQPGTGFLPEALSMLQRQALDRDPYMKQVFERLLHRKLPP